MISNKKRVRIIFVIFILIIFIFLIYFVSIKPDDNPKKVCFSEKCVEVEIVDTPETRMQGLMFRESLGDGEGMLFIFEEENIYPFWMKNTLIPLDMIWISQDTKIIDIKTAVPCEIDPCPNYSPSGKALYVLEVNAGFTDENEIEIGDTVRFD